MVRPKQLEEAGVSRSRFYRLVDQGLIERLTRGVYALPGHDPTLDHTLAVVGRRAPKSVFCLLTALRFHGLTTQSPAEVWLALSEGAREPRIRGVDIRVARFSGEALTEGIETHRVEGVEIRVYSPAKTVADCFKFRNKIGIDIAVEALRDFSANYRGGANDLAKFARICRVTRVLQPYLDSIA